MGTDKESADDDAEVEAEGEKELLFARYNACVGEEQMTEREKRDIGGRGIEERLRDRNVCVNREESKRERGRESERKKERERERGREREKEKEIKKGMGQSKLVAQTLQSNDCGAILLSLILPSLILPSLIVSYTILNITAQLITYRCQSEENC